MASEPALSGLSKLSEGSERFLARLVDAALARNWRTPEDFLLYFPPGDLLDALEAEPDIRQRLLVEAVGIPPKLASRHSRIAAHEDLEIALDEGLTEASRVLSLLPLDVQIRLLDPGLLFSFALDGDWLERATQDRGSLTQAAERVTFVLGAALSERLISMRDLASAIPLEQIAARASQGSLRKIFVYSLHCAQQHNVPDEARLLELVELPSLIAEIPFEQTWQNVVIERIAMPCGWPVPEAYPRGRSASAPRVVAKAPEPFRGEPVVKRVDPVAPRVQAPPPAAVPLAAPLPPAAAPRASAPVLRDASSAITSDTPTRVVSFTADTPPLPMRVDRSPTLPPSMRSDPPPPPPPPPPQMRISAPPRPVPAEPPPRVRLASVAEQRESASDDEIEVELEADEDSDFEFTQPLSAGMSRPEPRPPTRPPQGDLSTRASDGSRRRNVTDKLRKIGRLPTNHEYLSLAILRSISMMYEEIKNHKGKNARAQCIRECFDNDTHLKTGILALIELLDPSIAQLVETADSDTLIDTLLVQEKTIWQRASGKRPGAPQHAESVPVARRVAPPSRPLASAMPLTRVTKPGWRH